MLPAKTHGSVGADSNLQNVINKDIFNAKISGVWKSSLEQFGVDGAKYRAMKSSLM